jgi:GNAT superfamily N-acetyltransferase
MSLAEPVRLAEGQVAASGAVLARAFANDPFYTHTLSDPVERERLMPPYLAAWTRYGLLFGEVYVTAGPVEASAIWLPPSGVSRTEERMDQAGLTAVVGAFSDGARARYDAMGQHLGRIREAAPAVPHWHLPWMGVDPARQGLGLGSLLLRAGLSRVDQDGVESRLFTMQPRNVPLYQRYGFEIAVEGDVPDGGPHFWFMRRGPRPRSR